MSKAKVDERTKPIRADVEAALYARIERLATKEDLSISQVVRRALREYVEKEAA
jgi:predicted transcriptional regulator